MEDMWSLLQEEVKRSYRPRVIDSTIGNMLRTFGGVLITGPMWCGKSWTGVYHSRSSISIQNEDEVEYARINPQKTLEGETPRLIDEWQEVPKLWDYARGVMDSSASRGRFIFTGSSMPADGSTLHSGTGRFAHVRMRTMSLYESQNSSGKVSLTDLFNGARYESVRSEMDVSVAMRHICRGGWPAGAGLDDSDAMMIPRAYIESCLEKDYSKIDGKKRNPLTMRSVLESLARNCTAPVKKSVIAADVSRNGKPVKEETIEVYLDALRRTFVLDEQRPWDPEIRTRARVRGPIKYHLADPSIAAAILKVSPERLLTNPKTGGILFESLCYRDLSVYASSIGGEVLHYKDNTLEVDSVVELGDGRWGGVEVKQGTHDFDPAAENLLRLENRVSSKPSFLAILTASGRTAYTRDDGIHVIPLDCLGP
jgi:predicted AAA+ superfamily ATPase